MILKEFKPLKTLTVEDIQQLRIHTTLNGFRNETSTREVKKVPASDTVPTLYYVHVASADGCSLVWEVHALTTDLTRFLLIHSLKSKED